MIPKIGFIRFHVTAVNSTMSKLIKCNKGRGTQVIFHKDQRCIYVSVILEVNIVQLSSDIITLTLLVSTEVN